jgi:hypothetical protein
MHEGDLQAEQALPRLGVDQLDSRRCQLGERHGDVVDLVGDVVHPRPPFREKSADRRVIAERGEELDPAVADAHRRRLDPLLLDAGPVLEPAAEQPLVRLHRLVEVRHGDANVVDAASDHGRDASVRVSMGRRFRLALLLLAASLAAGCGGSSSNGEASKSPSAILADARQAALAADSVRIVGSVRNAGEAISLDLSVAQRSGGGTMTLDGSRVEFVRAGNAAYIRAGAAFYRRFGAGAAPVKLLADRWVKVPVTTPNFAELVSLTDLYSFVTQSLSTKGKVMKGAVKTVDGQKAIELRSSHGGSLYIAANGKPYPIEFTSRVAPAGTVRLSEWDSAKAPAAPKNAIDINKLGK